MRISPLFAAAILSLGLVSTASAGFVYTNATGVTNWDVQAPANSAGVGSPLNQSVVVSENYYITGLTFTATGLTHAWMGDLSFTLTAPDGITTMTIVGNHTGGGAFGFASNWNGTYTFADGGVNLWTVANGGGAFNIPTANAIQPNGARVAGGSNVNNSFASTFGGLSTQGTWTVNFADSFPGGDTGALTSWTVGFETAAPAPAAVWMGLAGFSALGLMRRRFLKA